METNLNSPVALTPCRDYDADIIEKLLREQMEELGVLECIQPGTKIAVKLNLVSAMKPDTAGTTHPAVVEALCRILIGAGAEVTLGDSPGGPFTGPYLANVYRICGITEVAKRTGAKLNNDFTQTDVTFPEAQIARNITMTSWLLNADLIINCCKLKTHGMMGMSAAVKNMFGSIPGTMKPEYHFRFPKQEDFANMLVDLQEFWKPKMAMHLVDGIIGMEGNGPTAGNPRPIGVLMCGQDPYALDLVGGRIIGLEQADVLTMATAYGRGLGAESADQVKLLVPVRETDQDELPMPAGETSQEHDKMSVASLDQMKEGTSKESWISLPATKENLAPYIIPDFQLLDNKRDLQFGGDSIGAKLESWAAATFLASRPNPNKNECIGCRKCEQICPAKAITMKKNLPSIDRSRCIKCFCCQEFCPKGAMKVQRTAIARLLAH